MLQPLVHSLFSQHYYTVHSFCRTDVECALCGSKCRHRATIDRSLPLRPVPQPQSINVLLQEAGNFDKCFTVDSVACNSCYLFCKRLLQQSDDDLRSPESIVHALTTKVTELQDRLQQCSNSSEHDEVELLNTAHFLGDQMLSDQAVTFPMLYQKYLYLVSRLTNDAPPLLRYKILVYVGKEFGT